MPPLLLMVLAGFWKHNIIVMPATAVLWLLLRDWSAGARPVLVCALAAAVGLFACGMIFGTVFYANLLTSRAYSVGHLVSQVGSLHWLALAGTIWGIWAWFSAVAIHSALQLCMRLSVFFPACFSGSGMEFSGTPRSI
ncbi:hypothetical protein [Bradyrhizobium sp. NBAIM01]|uniref:hypothetical protein n=1 Tax=Bradyrhizobium sp. NBAIM01 TaxID=2793818 RepID=UPI001CD68C1A|nr:hypothetical protein [Bradyrhizobium sp. NBAIM01]MCA1510252.1 hypothetical protein [Bradyrhizobium sp. NBAIM01]